MLLQPGAAVHAQHAAGADDQAEEPVRRGVRLRVERCQHAVEDHAGKGREGRCHERGPRRDIDGHPEERDEEGRDDRPAADAVDAACQAHSQAEQDERHGRHGVVRPLEAEGEGAPVEADDAQVACPGGAPAGPGLPFSQGERKARAHEKQHGRGEQLEARGVRQPAQPHERAQEDAGQRPRRDDHRHGPEQPPFPPVAPDACRAGQDVEDLVRGAHAGMGVSQHAHLEGQEHHRAGNAAHGREEGDQRGSGKGHQRVALYVGNGEIHRFAILSVRAGSLLRRVSPAATAPSGSPASASQGCRFSAP